MGGGGSLAKASERVLGGESLGEVSAGQPTSTSSSASTAFSMASFLLLAKLFSQTPKNYTKPASIRWVLYLQVMLDDTTNKMMMLDCRLGRDQMFRNSRIMFLNVSEI